MIKVSISIFSIFCVVIFLSCEKEESETEDCAGVLGGESICGCTDSEAINYDSTATYDDGSCEYNQNVDCAGVVGGDNICGCMDESAVNYNSQATFDNETCQYYSGQMNILWLKSYEEIGGEMWSLSPVSDGGFIMSLGNSTNCVDSQCDYLGQLIRLDANGDIIWEQKYEGSSALYSAIETSDGGFIAAGYFECNTSMDCYPDMYILKTDSDGAVQWSKTESSANNNNDWARDVIQTSDGNYVIAGTWSDDGWNSKASLRKYDTSGELIWGNIYTNSVANEAYELIETDEGDIVFAGYSGTQHGAYKFFVVKTCLLYTSDAADE